MGNLGGILEVIVGVLYFIFNPFSRHCFILSAISHFYTARQKKIEKLFNIKK